MRILHWHVTKQVLLTLLMTVAVFTFVLLLGEMLKEIVALLVGGHASLGLIFKAVGLLIPFLLVFALPMGMLTATLLVFGRFSADNELTAARANGVSLAALSGPVLLLSVALSGLCAWINLDIAPRCRAAYKQLLFRVGSEGRGALLAEDRFITEIPGYILYVRKMDGKELRDVMLYQLENGETDKRFTAESGELLSEPGAKTVSLMLYQLRGEIRNRGDANSPREGEMKPPEETPPGGAPPEGVPAPELYGPWTVEEASLMATNGESIALGPPPAPPEEDDSKEPVSEWVPAYLPRYEIGPLDLAAAERKLREPKLSEMAFPQLLEILRDLQRRQIDTSPVLVQIHRQISFSFASFGFTLIGIPLAIRAHRRETTAGVAMSLVLVLVYYSFVILGQALETKPLMLPHLIVWAPNFLFQALGGFLLWRVNRTG